MTEARLTLDHLDTPLGRLALVVADDRLRAVGWVGGDGRDGRMSRTLATLDLVARSNPAGLTAAMRSYFAGDVKILDALPVDLRGTPFQLTVWRALRDIPCGETISYGELARRIGRPSAVRAVGLANGANPVGIVVPCHRVIGASGDLTGYGAGLPRKRWLLDHEARAAGATGTAAAAQLPLRLPAPQV